MINGKDASEAEDYPSRVNAIDWSSYEGACGNPTHRTGQLLIQLAGEDVDAAVNAANGLWNILCHQHNVGPVAVPALPFLLEVLDDAPDELAVEIMDMLYGFAAWAMGYGKRGVPAEMAWVRQLRLGLEPEMPRFERLARHADEDLASYAQLILEEWEEDR